MEQQKQNTITDIIKPELQNIEAILSLSINNDISVRTLALQELNYLEQHAATKPIIAQCDPNSVILAVKNVLMKNLSLDPNAGLVYVKTRNLNVGTYQQPIWKTVLEIQETANGLLSYNRQLGRILDYTNPKVIEDAAGKTIGVKMELLKPSFPQPRWEEYSFNEGDFMRWRRASHKENKKGYKKNDSSKPVPDDEALNYANPNYTSWKNGMDPEFARAKCIRHSLKKLGSNPNEHRHVRLKPVEPIIDPGVAAAEADDNDFTPHEEVNSYINHEAQQQAQSISGNGHPPATDVFNPDDL